MSYRPITDCWILARSKVKYYGSYPSGFLHRARHVLGVHINDPVLHVCSGHIKEYPYRGLGPNDKTLDLDPVCNPDFLQDARQPYPNSATVPVGYWDGVMIDRPYSVTTMPLDGSYYPQRMS